jgi:carbamoyl-phosphate synthase large subunit
VLAGACSEIESTGAKLLISSEKAIEICQNKQLTAEFLGAQGLPIVPTLTPADISETDLPLIAKPRSGSASENVFKITEPLELEFLLKRHSDLIIQRHLSGPEYTVDVFCHFGDGKALSPVPRRRLKVRGGEVSVGCIERNAELETLTRKAVELVGIRGPANVQFILADSGPRILEINARFGGGCPLSLVGGAKYVEWCIDVALRRPLQCEEGPIRDGLTMMRYDASLFI